MIGRVLIVEDEAVLRKHLARFFAREGYEVSTASSSAEALDRLHGAPFDMLLLDLMLPDGDGLDLLAGLGERRPPRTVVMTASSDPRDERRAHALKAVMLRKPLDLLRLARALRGGAARAAPLPEPGAGTGTGRATG